MSVVLVYNQYVIGCTVSATQHIGIILVLIDLNDRLPSHPSRPTPQWHQPDAAILREAVFAQYRPAVQAALSSPQRICRYLSALDSGLPWNCVLVPPQWKGRMFYEDGLRDFNFVRDKLPVSAVLAQIARYSHFDDPPSVAMQCAPIADCIPGFVRENRLRVLGETVLPKLWLGNRFTTPAHFR